MCEEKLAVRVLKSWKKAEVELGQEKLPPPASQAGNMEPPPLFQACDARPSGLSRALAVLAPSTDDSSEQQAPSATATVVSILMPAASGKLLAPVSELRIADEGLEAAASISEYCSELPSVEEAPLEGVVNSAVVSGTSGGKLRGEEGVQRSGNSRPDSRDAPEGHPISNTSGPASFLVESSERSRATVGGTTATWQLPLSSVVEGAEASEVVAVRLGQFRWELVWSWCGAGTCQETY